MSFRWNAAFRPQASGWTLTPVELSLVEGRFCKDRRGPTIRRILILPLRQG
jgi:hypothetical protein